MTARNDLTGLQFGRLAVQGLHGGLAGKRVWLCVCNCGTEVKVITAKLVGGGKKSCGCLQKEVARATRTLHGQSRTPAYRAWESMRARCTRPLHYAAGDRRWSGRELGRTLRTARSEIWNGPMEAERWMEHREGLRDKYRDKTKELLKEKT